MDCITVVMNHVTLSEPCILTDKAIKLLLRKQKLSSGSTTENLNVTTCSEESF